MNSDTHSYLFSLVVVVAAVLLAASLVGLVPVGEAPDEPAHIAYVEHIVRTGSLPDVEGAWAGECYEAHQPPLAYGVMALMVRIAGFRKVGYEFVNDPAFRFERGTRALLNLASSPSIVRGQWAVRSARVANLVWLVVIEAMILSICLRVASSVFVAIASALPFCFAPQLLFTCSTANNDAAVIAFSSVVIFGLYILIADADAGLMTAVAVSVAAGLALWSKTSAVFLGPALGVAVVAVVRARRWKVLAALLFPGAILAAAWFSFSLARTGFCLSLPSHVSGIHPGGVIRLITDPWWFVSVWIGFWAKFGWFNLPLPALVYLVFVPASLAILIGFLVALFEPRFRSVPNMALILAVTTNVLILMAFMAGVDWQPQGRYLLPSIVAVAGLAAIGLEWLVRRWTKLPIRQVAAGSACCALVATATMLLIVATAY